MPVRNVATRALHSNSLLFTIVPIKLHDHGSGSVARRQELTASPPFGGNPPQARLCLWLI